MRTYEKISAAPRNPGPLARHCLRMVTRTPAADANLVASAVSQPPPGDVELAKRCAASDAEAIEALYRAHLGSVRAMARLHASHAAVAEDLVHDTFVRALELIDRYRGDAPLGLWLRGIAFNLARTQRRRAARRAGLLCRHALPAAHAPAPDERSALETLSKLIARLSDDEREAFTLRSVQRLSLEEVSALVGAAVSTVSDRDRRAKEKLRTWMKEDA